MCTHIMITRSTRLRPHMQYAMQMPCRAMPCQSRHCRAAACRRMAGAACQRRACMGHHFVETVQQHGLGVITAPVPPPPGHAMHCNDAVRPTPCVLEGAPGHLHLHGQRVRGAGGGGACSVFARMQCDSIAMLCIFHAHAIAGAPGHLHLHGQRVHGAGGDGAAARAAAPGGRQGRDLAGAAGAARRYSNNMAAGCWPAMPGHARWQAGTPRVGRERVFASACTCYLAPRPPCAAGKRRSAGVGRACEGACLPLPLPRPPLNPFNTTKQLPGPYSKAYMCLLPASCVPPPLSKHQELHSRTHARAHRTRTRDRMCVCTCACPPARRRRPWRACWTWCGSRALCTTCLSTATAAWSAQTCSRRCGGAGVCMYGRWEMGGRC